MGGAAVLTRVLRVLLGTGGIAAVAFGFVWMGGVVQVLLPGFRPNGGLAGYQSRSLVILGVLGVVASFVAGGCGLAYARTGARLWLAGVAAGVASGVLLFIVWIGLYVVFGDSG